MLMEWLKNDRVMKHWGRKQQLQSIIVTVTSNMTTWSTPSCNRLPAMSLLYALLHHNGYQSTCHTVNSSPVSSSHKRLITQSTCHEWAHNKAISCKTGIAPPKHCSLVSGRHN